MAKQKQMDIENAVKLILDSEEDSVPSDIYEKPELYLALTSPEADYYGMAWLVDNYMPASLKKNKDLMEKLVRHNPRVFTAIGSPLNEDAELLELALSESLDLFEKAGVGIKSNKKIVQDYFKRWIKENPNSLLPISWIPIALVRELKLIESFDVKPFPAKSGFNRFVIQISQEEVTEKNSDSALAKHESFVQTVIKDKKCELFGEIYQKDDSEDSESVETIAFFYVKDLTLQDMDDYLNNLAAKKVKTSSVMVYDIETPEYMNYSDGEVSSGSIDSDAYGDDFPLYENAIERPNLNRWPLKVLDRYL